jgi:hypothetical protein
MLKNIRLLIFLLALFSLGYPSFSRAAEIFLETRALTASVGQDLLVNVFLDTERETVNAIEGKVVFPQEHLALKEIRDGNSSINFWIERPDISEQSQVSFSGITPGGVSGRKEFLFAMVFRAIEGGEAVVELSEITALKNDGEGTPIPIKAEPLIFSISQTPSSETEPVEGIQDTEPPEDFLPVVGQDPEIFDGRYFLVFSAQDKGVGIDHFEVREGYFSTYMVAESPYQLKHQSLNKNIFVKAVDKAGNWKVVELEAAHRAKWNPYLFFAIILLVAAGLLLKKTWLKSGK